MTNRVLGYRGQQVLHYVNDVIEAECEELRKLDGFPLAVALTQAQRRIEAPEKHAGAMANDLGLLAEIHADQLEDFPEALQHAQQTLANWTAYLLGGR